MDKIIRDGDKVIYESDRGKRYILYKGVNLLKQGMINDGEMVHYMAFVVEEDPEGGACKGFFYIEGYSDEDLLSCCRRYVSK